MKNRNYKQHSVYLLPPEAGQIKQKADALCMSMSEFVRASALGNPLPSVRLIPSEHFRQLSAVGSNLNQIARRLNAGSQMSALAATEASQALLADIRSYLRSEP